MGEMTQEQDFKGPLQEEELKLQESINLSYLNLDNSNNNSAQQNRHSCATCACNLPACKRLKSIKLRMNEITNSWGETVKEMENLLCTEATKDKGELDCEEAVTVEKIGECLDIHFKCPCGKVYKILLSQKNCYYMLI